jgi:2-amino-4-hydroxy-6-hydroxymethyldihydropteridine diphosphokinase
VARAYLGLGSNLGDRATHLSMAVQGLDQLAGVRVLRVSGVYETDPQGLPDQPWFLNQVVEVETRLEPATLLEAAKELEQRLGRRPSVRWGPRVIDVDILLYDGLRFDTPTLTIPHRELWNRLFALRPLEELRPDLTAPDGRTIAAVTAALAVGQHARRLGPGDAPVRPG